MAALSQHQWHPYCIQSLLFHTWSQNQRSGQIISLLQRILSRLGVASDDPVSGEDFDPPSPAWADDVATIDAFQAKAIRQSRKRAKRKAEDEAWRRKTIEDVIGG